MKRSEPIKHRIFKPLDGTLVNIDTLSEQERNEISHAVFIRLADSLMWSQGYVRKQEDNKMGKNKEA